MKQWKSVDEALDFAIQNEQEAVAFYRELAGMVESPRTKEIFEGFAREEQGHKAKLERVKAGGMLKPVEGKILDLKIGDYLVEVEPGGKLDYQQALIIAMKREKAAFRLYSDMAAEVGDEVLRETFQALAQEEAKHKLRFEIEYDDRVFTGN